MKDEQLSGIAFPAAPDGRRSTASLGRAVVAAALRPVDPVGALAAERETAWRTNYVSHFRRLVEAGLTSPENWLRTAGSGLEAVHDRMAVILADGTEAPLGAVLAEPAGRKLETAEAQGDSGVRSGSEPEFVLPYQGRDLRGDDVRRRVADWVTAGVVEPSVADAVNAVLAHPQWLRLDGRTVVVLGAGAEMGPLPALLSWGATVAAVDLPQPAVWERLLETARRNPGRLMFPVAPGGRPASAAAGRSAADSRGGRRGADLGAGADLLTEVPAIADWLSGLPGALVLGNYAYADGGLHVRVSTAVDVLTQRLQAERDDVALAFLATPTDVFAVPPDAVRHATAAYEQRSRTAKLVGRPLRTVTRGRLLHRAYRPEADPGICDSLVPVQGPNYALAKRIQRWRAAVARSAGTTVSFHVAPSTHTRSVVKNRALAAAFAGAHHFGVEIFEPATANTLMAALLVHDLNTAPARHEHPWQDEAHAAAHGGLWRTAYAPRSALGLAALLGYASSRS
jgi:hypothetical protein